MFAASDTFFNNTGSVLSYDETLSYANSVFSSGIDVRIINSGVITGAGATGLTIADITSFQFTYIAAVGVAALQNATLTNSGTISAPVIGVYLSGTRTGTLTNTGQIDGAVAMSNAPSGKDLVKNSGNIDGNVYLNSGTDRYIGLADGVVTGTVFGGAGIDVLLGSAANETLSGGDGNDTVSGRVGDDILWGDVGDDIMLGGSGDDSIYGGDGNDTLTGASGRDVLFGDAGSDTFVYNAITESRTGAKGDIIRDFETGIDKIDLDALSATPVSYVAALTGTNMAEVMVTTTASGNSLIDIDIDGDGLIDSRIRVSGVTVLDTDFIL